MFRPDVRGVSLLVSMAHSLVAESAAGEGLEVGCGYGYLLFPNASRLESDFSARMGDTWYMAFRKRASNEPV
jgi:hypothetical protein